MKSPPIPPDDADRLRALRGYGVLDTDPEEPYDQATALAALICEAPFSLVTLVDENRQWFKSRHGWDAKESDRAISFCAHTINEPDLLVVPDATQDERFRGNPDVTGGPQIRFYAGVPLRNPEGHALGTLCVVDQVPRELTPDQAQALRVLRTHVMTLLELRRSRRDLNLSDEILDSLPGVFYVFDREGRFLRWNRRFGKVTGYAPEEIAELHPLDLFRGADKTHIEARIGQVFTQGVSEAEATLVGKDGAAGAYYFTGRALDIEGEPHLVGMGVDVSRMKELEAERERLFNLSPDPLCVVGFDGRFRDVNPAWKRVLGFARDELVGQPFRDLIHPDDLERTSEEMARNIQGGETRTFENRQAHRDGGWRWLSWHSTVDSGRGVVYALARDVTEEREVAEALRQSEGRYRTLVESARDAILTLHTDGTIASANQAFESITGWEREPWLGRHFEDLIHPEDLALGRELFTKLGREEDMPVFEIRVAGKDGAPIPVEVKATTIEVEPGERWALLVARDIRQRKALDERLRRINRLDAVGRLATGVAHDFNNLLSVVLSESDYLLSNAELSGEIAESVREIRAAGRRGAELSSRLLRLSRTQAPRLQVVELNDVVKGFHSMLDRLVDNRCKLEMALCAEPTTVRADPGMLEQVLMNLVINARDAMPEGGVVTIRTRQKLVDEELASRLPDARAGPYVHLSVTDQGTGIAHEDQGRIFEPLFTTKGEGQGTGLGLPTVHTIVHQHGGWLDLESEVGTGSTFHIHLPADLDPESGGAEADA
jgi:two-component system, cell cycle sensor histidine kinase and response regulator CckA